MNAVQLIKSKINKETTFDILQHYNITQWTDESDSWRCACAIHKGNNPSAFVWNYQTGLWYCFTGCQCGGDVFTFVAAMEDMSLLHEFKVVVTKCAEIMHIDISNMELGERADAHIKELRSWMKYMAKKNNISPKYDMKKLGSLYALNSYRNFTKETLSHFKACYCKEYNRIVIPIYDKDGICIGASMRRVDESEKAKWLHRPKNIEMGEVLYNFDSESENTTAMIMEGPFDVWNMHESFKSALVDLLATLGAHLTEAQEELLLSKYTKVVLAYDNDKAGKEATKKAIDKLKHKVDLYVLEYIRHDPGEILESDVLVPVKWFKWMEDNA